MLTRTRCLSISDPDWCWVQQSLGCTVFSEILCRNKNHCSRCESYFVFNQHSIFAQLDQPMRAVSRYSVAVAVVCSLSLSLCEWGHFECISQSHSFRQPLSSQLFGAVRPGKMPLNHTGNEQLVNRQSLAVVFTSVVLVDCAGYCLLYWFFSCFFSLYLVTF